MPTVTYNSQSFAIDGRRAWIVGASIHYARVPVEHWADRLAAIRQGGFNTVLTACPWSLHEPRKGRFDFEGPADIGAFLRLCAELDLRVVLRAGPFIGDGYDSGGLPAWLGDIEELVPREANEAYLERVFRYQRKLAAELAPLQVTQGGPLLLVQCEHGWNCSNRHESERYLGELTRILRESGIDVPLITANDLWTEVAGTIETWRGWERMLGHVRQLRTVQPEAPRLVSELEVASSVAWGDDAPEPATPQQALHHFAEILAGGSQPIVAPFHGGTSFGFTGGLLPGRPGGAITTTVVADAPLGESGERTPTYRALRRLAMCASSFGAVFADLDPDYQPVTIDPIEPPASGTSSRGRGGFSVVPLRGSQGRVVFMFAHGASRETRLLLDNGLSLPVDLGDQTVGWYLLDVDLQGMGRLDYCNLCLAGTVGRSIVVLHGPEKSPVLVSVGGTPMQDVVPTGRKPLVVEHRGITFVICNRSQIDWTYDDGERVFVGVDGFGADGTPRPAPGYARAVAVSADGTVKNVSVPGASGKRGKSAGSGAPKLGEWEAAPSSDRCEGTSPRYATLDGPRTLPACGAPVGYGWYRFAVKVGSTGKKLLHLPGAADRIHLFIDGEPIALVGAGPGAEPGPVELRLTKGEHTMVALVDNLGRFGDGNDLLPPKGLYDHVYEVKELRTIKPKKQQADPINPFDLRGFIKGLALGQLSDSEQVVWTFTHARKAPIIVDIDGAAASGTLVLNDQPLAYYAGAGGMRRMRMVLHPAELDAFKRGKNVLRFAPDLRQEDPVGDVTRNTRFFECTAVFTATATWSFAKWEPPAMTAFETVSKAQARRFRGRPCWWRGSFGPATGDSLRLEMTGLSKGQAYLNGQELGRYFTARGDGRAVGPQTQLYLPGGWLNADGPNELLLFDEHGFDPSGTSLTT
ncbi:MAG: beta-galactosidase [Planctomycetota bacterium]|jgi:hypothetical protein